MRSLVIACPHSQGRTGEFVIEGIKEFLDIKDDDAEVHRNSGFIVEHPHGKPLMLSYDQQRSEESLPPPELARFAPVSERPTEVFEFDLNLVPGVQATSYLMP